MRVTRRLLGVFPYTTVHPKPHLQKVGEFWICRAPGVGAASHAYLGHSPRAAWDAWARWWLI